MPTGRLGEEMPDSETLHPTSSPWCATTHHKPKFNPTRHTTTKPHQHSP